MKRRGKDENKANSAPNILRGMSVDRNQLCREYNHEPKPHTTQRTTDDPRPLIGMTTEPLADDLYAIQDDDEKRAKHHHQQDASAVNAKPKRYVAPNRREFQIERIIRHHAGAGSASVIGRQAASAERRFA